MRDLLEGLSKKDLVDFLVDYAETDTKFTNALNMQFQEPVYEEELVRIENDIDYELADVSDFSDRNKWGNLIFDVSSIYFEMDQRKRQGHIRLAFDIAALLYCKLLEIFEYQGECEVSDEASSCIKEMSDISRMAVNEQDKAYIYHKCIELAALEDGKDYGADYEDELLGISAKFATTERRTELEHALESALNSNVNGYEFNHYRQELVLLHYKVVNKLDGRKAGDRFIADNLRFPVMREKAYERAMSKKDYAEAEKLCQGALFEESQTYKYQYKEWLNRLYSVFETSHNTKKMAEVAESILLRGELVYFDKLEKIHKEQETWDSYYPKLLEKCRKGLSVFNYMQLLKMNREYELLLGQLKEHPDTIFWIGISLADSYPSEIWSIFSEQIHKNAQEASDRKSYRLVCSEIKPFAQAGFQDEAAALINDLKSEYMHRPAFVDELSKI